MLHGECVANKENSKKCQSHFSKALNVGIMINQALIDLLVAKGIITQEDLRVKIEKIRKELPIATYIDVVKSSPLY